MGRSTTECLSAIRVSFAPEEPRDLGVELADVIAKEVMSLRGVYQKNVQELMGDH